MRLQSSAIFALRREAIAARIRGVASIESKAAET